MKGYDTPALFDSPLSFLLEQKVPSEAKDRPTQNNVDVVSLAARQIEQIVVPAEQNALGPSSPDLSPPSVPSQGL